VEQRSLQECRVAPHPSDLLSLDFYLEDMSTYKTVTQSAHEKDLDLESEPFRWRSWRVTVAIGALISTIVLLANIGVLTWTLLKFEVKNGIATVFEGIFGGQVHQ
jgi:hypothetical protein